MSKQRRNDKCSCGSGKKYKHCCISKGKAPFSSSEPASHIEEVLQRSLSPNRADRDSAENELRSILDSSCATKIEKITAAINLVMLAQHRGDHKEAIQQLDALDRAGIGPMFDKQHLRAISLSQLGKHQDAAALVDKLQETFSESSGTDPNWWSLEAGRIYSFANRIEDAIRVTQGAVTFFEANKDSEHWLRAKSNLATFMLKSTNADEVRKGEEFLLDTWHVKLANGDPEGASTNLCQLSLHYLKCGRFERAIAFGRKDLKLSRLVGNERLVASTLCNMAYLYLESLQLSEARNAIRQATDIGEKLDNTDILQTCRGIALEIEKRGRNAGKRRMPIGESAFCPCKSGQRYVECCGRADHEPELNMTVGGPTEDIDEVREFLELSGLEPVQLDYALRESKNARQRFSWTRHVPHDGWWEILEMPDMANMHLNAAEALADRAMTQPDAVDEPIACAMLTVSALEAFINSTIYFTVDAAKKRHINLLSELQTNASEYQRRTDLTRKWNDLGMVLCVEWPPPSAIWDNFIKLVQLRNELVHFKAEGFARVFPQEKHLHPYLRNLPLKVELRDAPRSWPVRLLTPTFARWTVDVANDLISYFRANYRFGLAVLKSTNDTN